MKRLIISVTLFFQILPVVSQPVFNDFINTFNQTSDTGVKASLVSAFIDSTREKGIPFIEDTMATFLYFGNTSQVSIAGDFNGWNPSSSKMTKLSGFNFHYKTMDFERQARLDYKFVLSNGSWILDPENPHQVSGGFGPNSELAMPDYVQPWEITPLPGLNRGTSHSHSIYSNQTGRTYSVTVYVPPSYNQTSQSYPVVYFQDGSEYISLGAAKTIIDNLRFNGSIREVIAVFVTPNNREDEYATTKRHQYRQWFSGNLVGFMDSTYRTIQQPSARAVIGDSWGGNISALIAWNHPDVFGLAGLHSLAAWPNNYEADQLIRSEKKNVKSYLVWGTYEGLQVPMGSLVEEMDAMGYEFDFAVYPEGHSWGLWRATLDDVLMYFFPAAPTSAQESVEVTRKFRLNPVYPNPFNPETTISYQLETDGLVTLTIRNIIGQTVATLADGVWRPAGYHSLSFQANHLPSGIYLFTLESGNQIQVQKGILVK